MERVWFEEAVTGRPRSDSGIEADPDESFALAGSDTTDSVRSRHLEVCAASRRAVEHLGPDDVVSGDRRGPLPLRWVHLHVLRELAQHCGHADIPRQQLLAAREG